jgi:hypothetical protein
MGFAGVDGEACAFEDLLAAFLGFDGSVEILDFEC